MQRRAEIDARYREQLAEVPSITCLPKGHQTVANHSYFPVLIGKEYSLSRDELYENLKNNNIYARRYFYPFIANFSMYKNLPSADRHNLSNAYQTTKNVICLPIYPNLEKIQQLNIIDKIINP